MPYMLLIVEPTGQRHERGRLAGEASYQCMLDYTRSLQERGMLLASQSLKTEAARLEKHNGKARVLDGPFAEAKEVVGGFFLLDCATRAEALELAQQCPAADWATIDVREVGPCYE
jgi:hypothetical protein